MDRLRARFNGYDLCQAGIPYYPGNFTRNSIISAILLQNPEILRRQLSFCAEKQGKKKNPYSGEEPGKTPKSLEGKMENRYTDPEIVILERKGFRKAGCDPLLLSIAAKTYFKACRSEPQSPC